MLEHDEYCEARTEKESDPVLECEGCGIYVCFCLTRFYLNNVYNHEYCMGAKYIDAMTKNEGHINFVKWQVANDPKAKESYEKTIEEFIERMTKSIEEEIENEL